MSLAVRAVPIPDGGLAGTKFHGVDYADAYALVLPRTVSARTFAEAVLPLPRAGWPSSWPYGTPSFGRSGSSPHRPRSSMLPLLRTVTGERIGIFPVLANAPDEVLMGLDDRHLDFRVSVRVLNDGGERLGVVTTLVRFHGVLGRARGSSGRGVDVHVFDYDERGRNTHGVAYPHGSLTGTGTLAGRRVRCVAAEWMFRFKTAYPPSEKDLHDVERLAEEFGFTVPATHRKHTRSP